MYWIEVYFQNGKTLRKESDSINETYVVLTRYNNGNNNSPKVNSIKCGRDDTVTYYLDKLERDKIVL